jgi:hypothetical protein
MRNDAGLALWVLRIHGADVPGRWVIVDGQFVPEGAIACIPSGLRQGGPAASRVDENSAGAETHRRRPAAPLAHAFNFNAALTHSANRGASP